MDLINDTIINNNKLLLCKQKTLQLTTQWAYIINTING